MADDAFAARVTRVGALADPIRRRLYRFVSRQPDAVSRDQAADAVAVPHHTARFHLERLVEAGLLVTEFRRLTGRTGPGAGRPAKLYRRSRKEVAVSVPSRRYDLAGEVLAVAVEQALAGAPVEDALDDAATEAARSAATSAPDEGEPRARLRGVLARLGYEPQGDDETTLGNCPYHRLAAGHPDLVCGVNAAFVRALDAELGGDAEVHRRDGGPDADACCLRIARSRTMAASLDP
jgi:predicted ArsR family transcriptional regulator